ncbi:MAG: hypothetical protein Q7T55_00690 [Solirubrobacteraceae bacterium]|nr:hypothetical protein [Solirubrobacteraceae bacterium]
MRVRWATTCEASTIDDRGAHSLVGVGANLLRLRAGETKAHTPLFVCLSVPRHELDTELDVAIVVVDPQGRPAGSQTHVVAIPSGQLPVGAMDGYEVPAYLSTVVNFEVTSDGAYSVFVTPPLRDGEVPPEPLTVFVERAAAR